MAVNCPLLAAAGALAAGIAIVPPGGAASNVAVPVLLGGSASLMLAGLLILRRPSGRDLPARRSAALTTLLLAGFLLAGATAGQLFKRRFPAGDLSQWKPDQFPSPAMLTGYLVSSPLRTSELEFDLEATEIERNGRALPTSGKVRVWVAPPSSPGSAAALDSLRLAYGDVIRADVQFRRPRVYRNPGSFDFGRRMLEIEDVAWEGSIRTPASIVKLGGHRAGLARRLLAGARERLLRGIDRLYPPWSLEGRDGAVLKAVLCGDRSSLDSSTIESFRQSGLYHLLVIAGLHVGLLAMLLAGVLRLLGLGKVSRRIVLLVLLLIYAGLVEQRAATMRATLMIVAWMLSGLFDRRHSALNAIGIAALVLLVDRPAWLRESGFELSFAAALLIAGIAAPILMRWTEPRRNAMFFLQAVDRDAAFSPRLAQFRLDLRAAVAALRRRVGLLDRRPAVAEACVTLPLRGVLWTVNLVLFSAILQLGLLLPMVETFHRVTFAGIGLNALAVPVMIALLAVALPTTLLATVLPAQAVLPGRVTSGVLSALFGLTHWSERAPWLSYRVPDPPYWVAIGFALSVVVAAMTLGRSRRALLAGGAGFAFFALLLCVHPFPPRLPSGVMEVTALDCGGGQAIFMVLPDRTTVLVGACGRGGRLGGEGRAGVLQAQSWNPGESIVSPYLWSRGIGRIDVVVLPDVQSDDAAGLSSVIANFRVGELWRGPWPEDPRASAWREAAAGLLAEADKRAVRVREVAAGDTLVPGSTSLQVLWPARAGDQARPGSGPLILRATMGEASALATERVDERAQAALARLGTLAASTVLAMEPGQAGSGSDFLTGVQPRVVLLAGANPRATPSPSDEITPLEALGARVFRTDLDGAVTVVMAGHSLAVRTEQASKER